MKSNDRTSARERLAEFQRKSDSNQRRVWLRIGFLSVVLLLAVSALFYLERGQPQGAVETTFPQDVLRAVESNAALSDYLDDTLEWSMDGAMRGGKSDLLKALAPFMTDGLPFVGNIIQSSDAGDVRRLLFLCGVMTGDPRSPNIHPVVKTVLVDLSIELVDGRWLASRVAVRQTF